MSTFQSTLSTVTFKQRCENSFMKCKYTKVWEYVQTCAHYVWVYKWMYIYSTRQNTKFFKQKINIDLTLQCIQTFI